MIVGHGTERAADARVVKEHGECGDQDAGNTLVEDGEEYAELRGALLYGKCQVVDEIDAVKETLIDIAGGPADPAAREGMAKAIEGTAAKRVLLVTRPDEVVSWDHRKLGGRY